VDLVSARGEPAEDLVQVDLGAARERIRQVLPVEDEDPQTAASGRRPPASSSSARNSASSTPLTNLGLSAVP
jgi:hypothetical protein